MSDRKFKLPSFKELKDKFRPRSDRAETERETKSRTVGALGFPEEVGESKTVVDRAGRRQKLREGNEDGVVASLDLETEDRRSRRLEIPEHVRNDEGHQSGDQAD